MKYFTFLGILLLNGCSGKINAPCPQIVPYSKADQFALEQELKNHQELKEIPRWLEDYIGLRDQVRACQKKRK